MSARAWKATLTFVAASAIALTGCTSSGWVEQAPPAAGAQGELSVRLEDGSTVKEKARNVFFVVDEQGDGFLAGTISSVAGTQVTSIQYAAQQSDSAFGEPAALNFHAKINSHDAVRLEQVPVKVSNSDLTPGRLARMVIVLDTGQISLEVPVYSSKHKDYQELWQQVQG